MGCHLWASGWAHSSNSRSKHTPTQISKSSGAAAAIGAVPGGTATVPQVVEAQWLPLAAVTQTTQPQEHNCFFPNHFFAINIKLVYTLNLKYNVLNLTLHVLHPVTPHPKP